MRMSAHELVVAGMSLSDAQQSSARRQSNSRNRTPIFGAMNHHQGSSGRATIFGATFRVRSIFNKMAKICR